MSVSYRNQIAITDYLIERLEIGLSGRGEAECHGRLPTDKYQLGVLAPRQHDVSSLTQPAETDIGTTTDAEEAYDSVEANSKSHQISETDDEPEDTSPSSVENADADRLDRADISQHRGIPSTLGAEFIVMPVNKEPVSLIFEVSFAFYTRRFPTWEQIQERLHQPDEKTNHPQRTVKIGDRHVRHCVEVGPFSIQVDPSQQQDRQEETTQFIDAIEAHLRDERTKPDVWRNLSRMSITTRVLGSPEQYQGYLHNLQEEVETPPLAAHLEVRTLRQGDESLRVGVYLVNDTEADERSIVRNTTRFLFDGRFVCVVENAELVPIEIASAPQDYQYDPRVWAVGQGCAVEVDVLNRTLTTRSLAQYDQPRLVTKNEPEAPFDVMKRSPIPLLEDIHQQMLAYAERWEVALATNVIELRSTEEIAACRRDLEAFQNEIGRFEQGITALKNDSILLEAFQAMHRVFERVGAPRKITHWRLFQLGFIVTQLPSLAFREGRIESNTLDYADVLWFPTGGGKTEAYFGLISCALLYDRLRGKSAGVTAWLRFPLRMLSVQQLQRAVKMVYETEVERQVLLGDKYQDSDPISLGYFVGNSSTPNYVSNADWNKWKVRDLVARRDLRDKLKLVRECPRCAEKAVEIEVDANEYRIKHVCQSCGLDLNIYISDDEIYRYLPSVLIGTVDKLPSVAWRRHFAHLWGGVDSRCPEHGYRSGDWCIVFGCSSNQQKVPVKLYDPVPCLQIQDELHLLREELGTFAGHYETLAQYCESYGNRLPPKILAATATVEGLDRQGQHLYGLRTRRFPAKGYQLGESFYTQTASEEGQVAIARRYLGFRSPVLSSPDATKLVLEILHSEIRQIYTLLITGGLDAIIEQINLEPNTSVDDLLELLDNYDTTLTYVGSKAHGSRIERALTDDISQRVAKAGSREIKVSYLNGESTMDDIANTIEALEEDTDWNANERLDAVIGTSLISHGVDVSRLNVMTMAGMPGRTAEYIQSSSRSGRRYIGIIIVALSPWLLREQSYYHRFVTYHYHMEHLVEPVPINRFSRFAVDKTMPGVLAGLLNAVYAPMFQIDLTRVREVQKLVWNSGQVTQDALLEDIHGAYGLDSTLHSKSLRSGMEQRVDAIFRREMRRLNTPSRDEKVARALSRIPMTSLRDVDQQVAFEPRDSIYTVLPWTRR